MFLTAVMIIVSVTIVALLSVVFIRRKERLETDQMLLLLCETGERNLDYYFDSVQESVAKVASYAEYDIDGLETEKLEDHVTRIRDYFEETAGNTNGVLTYYYRIDPEVSETVKGFWYTNLDGTGFREHDVTDITLYDTQDTSKLVWFTVPKNTGKPVWLPPYITDNLDVRVVSHNIPISWKNRFVGVVGIELDYSMIAEQVSSIRLYSKHRRERNRRKADNHNHRANDQQGDNKKAVRPFDYIWSAKCNQCAKDHTKHAEDRLPDYWVEDDVESCKKVDHRGCEKLRIHSIPSKVRQTDHCSKDGDTFNTKDRTQPDP